MLSQALAVTTFAGSVLAAVPYSSLPLQYVHGDGHKISTYLVDPHSNRSVEVVVDQGSENFWVFGPDSINNWGCTALMCQGPCNVTVQPFYDYPNSPTASKPQPYQSLYNYGGNTKIIEGEVAVNDSLLFVSDAGVSSTIDTRVAISEYMQQRIPKLGNECGAPAHYDHGILGTGPFLRTPEWNTSGPHVRQNLLESGAISAPVQSMWFDKLPEHIKDTFTGNAVFGGIDHSKYSGDLVQMKTTSAPKGPTVGYYVRTPVVKVNNITMDQGDISQSCLIDSGTTVDELPISNEDAEKFAKATGLSISETGVLGWNGTCESIPRDTTIDLEFTGMDDKTVTIKVPLRTYARTGISSFSGMCEIAMSTGDCLLGAPFGTAAFFAADDAAGTVGFAQGGVSKRGSAPDAESITLEM